MRGTSLGGGSPRPGQDDSAPTFTRRRGSFPARVRVSSCESDRTQLSPHMSHCTPSRPSEWLCPPDRFDPIFIPDAASVFCENVPSRAADVEAGAHNERAAVPVRIIGVVRTTPSSALWWERQRDNILQAIDEWIIFKVRAAQR